MTKDKWIWMPHAAHFIGGKYCQFHLATKIGKYIVSTVGEWEKGEFELERDKKLPPSMAEEAKSRFRFINLYGPYETMVFKARKSKNEPDWKCCHYEIIVSKQVDEERYKTATEAYKGHMKLCEKWSKKK